MIARFYVLLPSPLHTVPFVDVTPIEYNQDGVSAKIYFPVRAVASAGSRPLQELRPDENQMPTAELTVNGAPTVAANLLCIEIAKPEFDRQVRDVIKEDPPTSLFFKIANWWVEQLRAVANAAYLRPLMEGEPWLLEYLNDDGSKLPDEMPSKYRRRVGKQQKLNVTVIDSDLWNRMRGLGPNYTPARYQMLILDAYALWPDVGPCIVLAATALETVIQLALAVLAKREGGKFELLWRWISDRGDKYWQEPSVADLFGEILAIAAGKDLRDQNLLWEAFKNLKEARNKFVHEGEAKIGKKPVTSAQAGKLIDKADEIVKWVGQLLPPEISPPKMGKEYKVESYLLLNF